MRGAFQKSTKEERKYLVGPVEAGGEVAQQVSGENYQVPNQALDGGGGASPSLFRKRVGKVREV